MSKRTPRPTDAELAILGVLWESGPCSVREVHEALAARGGDTGYTTTLKLLQLMHGKGLALRDESQRAHRYVAAVRRSEVEQHLVGELVRNLFGGSGARLALQALGNSAAATETELDAIRALISRMEEEGSDPAQRTREH